LHVLGLPLAFILSQDQTLHCNLSLLLIAGRPKPADNLLPDSSGYLSLLQHFKELYLNLY